MLFKLREASLKKCFLSGIILSYWPGVNYIHGYMTRGADLRLSFYSSRSKRGHQKFIIYARKLNWLFLQRRYKKIELWSVQKTNWKKKFEKSCDWFKKQIEKKSFKKVVIGLKNKLKKSWKKVVIGLRGRAAARSGLPTPLGDPTIHFCQRTFANCHFLFVFVFVLPI